MWHQTILDQIIILTLTIIRVTLLINPNPDHKLNPNTKPNHNPNHNHKPKSNPNNDVNPYPRHNTKLNPNNKP